MIAACDRLYDTNRPVYGVLGFILSDLASEYDGQAITIDCYDRIKRTRVDPVLSLLEADSS